MQAPTCCLCVLIQTHTRATSWTSVGERARWKHKGYRFHSEWYPFFLFTKYLATKSILSVQKKTAFMWVLYASCMGHGRWIPVTSACQVISRKLWWTDFAIWQPEFATGKWLFMVEFFFSRNIVIQPHFLKTELWKFLGMNRKDMSKSRRVRDPECYTNINSVLDHPVACWTQFYCEFP